MDNIKEIYFDEYCQKCMYSELSESEDPCWDCLENPYREDSHKPEYFKEDICKKSSTLQR